MSSQLQSQIPVIVERPEDRGGGSVLYLYDRVEYLKYPGEFPMTEALVEGLRRIEVVKKYLGPS